MRARSGKLCSLLLTLFLCHLTLPAAATTYYVDINSPNPTPPYTSWSTAATNIQDAIAQTADGDSVLVNPGIYQSAGFKAPDGSLTAVVVSNAISIQSVNGAATTWINGGNAMRCVYLGNGSGLTGFTLTNGSASNGGGIYSASTAGAVLSNCVITANTAMDNGGGAYQGTFWNCTISKNFTESAAADGGGAYDAVLIDCMIISNSIFGGYGCGTYNSSVTNSLIANNFQSLPNFEASEGGGAYGGNLDHCNITGNSATTGGGTYSANLLNCINYYNTINPSLSNQPNSSNYFGGTITYTCTAPNPGYLSDITADPQLASASHISLTSPCRGAGTSDGTTGVDIDGNPWANPPSMGCFEPYPGSEFGGLAVAISTPFTNWAPGFALNFQANISGPVYSNIWSFGDGTSITNEAYVSHTWSAAGTYPVTLTGYNDSYPTGVTATVQINVAVPSIYYVNLNSQNPVAPYITWGTAAVNIQDAVNVATPGSLVLVTNGPTVPSSLNNDTTNSAAFYMGGGATAPDGSFYRVVITNAVTVQSVNGAATTYIWGTTQNQPSGSCVYLANGATLSGFTVTNYTSDSSSSDRISAVSTNAVVTNCVLASYANVNGGQIENCLFSGSGCTTSLVENCSFSMSGTENSTLNDCVLSNNSSVMGGTLNGCVLVNNTNSSGNGGVATAAVGYPLVLNDCLISNTATIGVANIVSSVPSNCILNNCILTRNSGHYTADGSESGSELNNCLIISNQSYGAEGGELNNCTLIGNSSGGAGSQAILNNCTLSGNLGSGGASSCTLNECRLSENVGHNGGGADGCFLYNCLLISNMTTTIAGEGGGAYFSNLSNCVVVANIATNGGGAYSSTLVNCVISANTAVYYGGGADNCSLSNCTVVANTAATGGGIYDSRAANSILYDDTNGDFYPNTSQYPLNYCCTPVLPAAGLRNITNAPLFVNLAAGDYHLQSSSPCINSGNNAYVTTPTDLDGNQRIAGSTVDIGAYEYPTPSSVISYAYLQQYGLPTDGSVDFADLDGTAFNVYQDWIAGLNPTNPASILAMLTPVTTNTATGVTVTWQSVSGIPYFLQRSTNLAAQPPFSTLQSNIIGQTNTTAYTDTTATNNLPYFYRVGVTAP